MNNVKIFVGCLVAVALMLGGVLFFNKISKKEDNKQTTTPNEVLEYNNVEEIDGKLGDRKSVV